MYSSYSFQDSSFSLNPQIQYSAFDQMLIVLPFQIFLYKFIIRLPYLHNLMIRWSTTIIFCLIYLTICEITPQQSLPELHHQIETEVQMVYEVQQEQTFIQYCSPQSALTGTFHTSCHIHNAEIDIKKIMELPRKDSSMHKNYLFNKNSNSLYELSSSQINVFEVDWKSNHLKQLNVLTFQKNCTKNMLLDYSGEKLFIFSCEGVYTINTREKLSTYTMLFNHSYLFNSHKTLRCQDLIFQLSLSYGIHVYGVDIELNLSEITRITHFKGHEINAADLIYADNKLMIADRKLGVLVFMRVGKQFKPLERFHLKLEEQLDYGLVLMWKNTLFVAVESQSESFVVECQLINNKFYLVRYYKGYQVISHLSISDNKLVIQSNSKIDIFPVNRDPRLINHLFNGYSYSHDKQLLSVMFLEDNKYLLVASNNIMITTWQLIDKKIECQFSEIGSYELMYKQPCFQNLDFTFNHECSRINRLKIAVVSSHKDNYLWLLLIFIAGFFTVIMMLMYWREIKVQKIQYIVRQIKEFQIKKKEIEFKELDQLGNDLVARSRNWDDLSDNQKDADPFEEFAASQRKNLSRH